MTTESFEYCSICFEKREVVGGNSSCQHQFCSPCFKTWIETCEFESQSAPSCPQCRQKIDNSTVVCVLGRDFDPTRKKEGEEEGNNSEEIDEFTLTALQEMGAVLCGNCGAWIVRDDGCSAMECICGFRFCMKCEKDYPNCTCEGGSSVCAFFDNITGGEYSTDDDIQQLRRVAEGDEILNLRAFIECRREAVENYRRKREAKEEAKREKKRCEILYCIRYLFQSDEASILDTSVQNMMVEEIIEDIRHLFKLNT